jgi:PAS domain S-box-containing protein
MLSPGVIAMSGEADAAADDEHVSGDAAEASSGEGATGEGATGEGATGESDAPGEGDDECLDSTYRAVVEAAGDGLFALDGDGRFRLVNRAFATLVGRERGDLRGAPFSTVADEDTVDLARDCFAALVARDREVGTFQFPVDDDPDRTVVEVRCSLAPPDSPGRFVGVARDVTDRVRRRHDIERQRDRFAHLHRISSLVWEVDQALVTAATQEEIERDVCTRLADSALYEVAWIGRYDRRCDRLVPQQWAGVDGTSLSGVELSGRGTGSGTTPWREAIATGVTQVARPNRDRGTATVSAAELEDAYESWAVVPLVHKDVVHGTLNLYADRPHAFGVDERTGLTELGKTVGSAITAAKERKLLYADAVVELEFVGRDRAAFFVDASARTDCRFVLEGTVPVANQAMLTYVRLQHCGADRVRELADDADDVRGFRVVDDAEDAPLVELVVRARSSLIKRLNDCGARVVTMVAEDGEARIATDVPPDEDVRAIVEGVRELFPAFDLVARRETERGGSRPREATWSLPDSLTDRQRAALRSAYYAGYFDWPRASTAEDVAASMGIAGATFHKHLRKGEQRVFDALLDPYRD